MTNFNEHALEMSIMELFKDEEYTYVSGDQIHRERTEVLLTDDLKQYLYDRYARMASRRVRWIVSFLCCVTLAALFTKLINLCSN